MAKTRKTGQKPSSPRKKIKKSPVKRTRRAFHQYNPHDMVKALEAVREGLSTRKAADKFKVPRSSLAHKKLGRGPPPEVHRMGPPPVLTVEEEEMLVNWLLNVADAGFPISKQQLLDNVQSLMAKLGRPNPFKDGRPGEKWFTLFLKRHPDISLTMAQSVGRASSSVTEESLKNWFQHVRRYCRKMDCESALEDPRRIFNLDETAFCLTPGYGRVLLRKNTRTVPNSISDNDREYTSVLLGGNAAGTPTPSMLISMYKIEDASLDGIPPEWMVVRSESGWTTPSTFYDYIKNGFKPFLDKKKIPLPVILYVDGHGSDLSLELSKFCNENQIIVIALYSNATHITHPMDVTVFRPFKKIWKDAVQKYNAQNEKPFQRNNFPSLFAKVFKSSVNIQDYVNGFEVCGLFPFDENNVGVERIIVTKINSPSEDIPSPPPVQIQRTERTSVDLLATLEQMISCEKLCSFLQKYTDAYSQEWPENHNSKDLYDVWKELKQRKQAEANIEAAIDIASESEPEEEFKIEMIEFNHDEFERHF